MLLVTVAHLGGLAALAALAGCGKPSDGDAAASPPVRKAGLWEQVITRDGKPGRFGVLKVCLDADADHKLGVFGRHFAKSDCQKSVTKDATGLYHFTSSCALPNGGSVKSMGTASGDFDSNYSVHSEVNVTGAPLEPVNGMHVVDLTGTYKGPCPSGMRPGDVNLGSGLTVNIDRLQQLAGVLGGG